MEQEIRTNFSIDTNNLTTSMSRVFDAPRELVYRVVTDGEQMPKWWGPAYLTSDVELYDVREGGKWRIVQRDPDGSSYAFYGEFREVTPLERLVYTFIFEGFPDEVILETITFEDLNGKTLMTALDKFSTLEGLKGMADSGMESGAVESWERLAKLVAQQA